MSHGDGVPRATGRRRARRGGGGIGQLRAADSKTSSRARVSAKVAWVIGSLYGDDRPAHVSPQSFPMETASGPKSQNGLAFSFCLIARKKNCAQSALPIVALSYPLEDWHNEHHRDK